MSLQSQGRYFLWSSLKGDTWSKDVCETVILLKTAEILNFTAEMCEFSNFYYIVWKKNSTVSNCPRGFNPVLSNLTFHPKSWFKYYILHLQSKWLTVSTLVKVFFKNYSATECPSRKKQHHACLTLFPLSIHYAIKSRFADDVNEANCIPVGLPRLVKQTSASQLKQGKKGERYSVFSGLRPECLFWSVLSSLLNASWLWITK